MKHTLFATISCLFLSLNPIEVHGAYSAFVASQGASSRTVQIGESFNVDVILFSDVLDVHNSAIFRVVISAPGLFFDSYVWSAPYSNGTGEDDSRPLARQLPLLLHANTLGGIGYPTGVVDVELSNVTSIQPAFSSGNLVRLTLSVPLDYSGPTNLSISIDPESFANGFIGIPTVAENALTLTIVEKQSFIRPLVSPHARWQYLDDGSDQGSIWRNPEFDSSSWSNGNAKLGYGKSDEVTVVGYGPEARNKHVTTYFRNAFVVPDRSTYGSDLLRLRTRRDDGLVVYLNGTEVFRDNMPSGLITSDTLASSAAADDGDAWISGTAAPTLLVNGTNILAAEVHQVDRGSSDMSFDLELCSVGCVSRKLSVLFGTNGIQLVLPCAADGYRVEAASALTAPANWQTVTNPPQTDGLLRTIVIPNAGGNRFFRLTKP